MNEKIPSSKDLAAKQRERILSDANLINSGAEVTSEGGIIATEDQKKEAEAEMNKDSEAHVPQQEAGNSATSVEGVGSYWKNKVIEPIEDPQLEKIYQYQDKWKQKSAAEQAALIAEAKGKFQKGEVYNSRGNNVLRLESIDDNGEVSMKHLSSGSYNPKIYLEELMDLNPDARAIPQEEWIKHFGG